MFLFLGNVNLVCLVVWWFEVKSLFGCWLCSEVVWVWLKIEFLLIILIKFVCLLRILSGFWMKLSFCCVWLKIESLLRILVSFVCFLRILSGFRMKFVFLLGMIWTSLWVLSHIPSPQHRQREVSVDQLGSPIGIELTSWSCCYGEVCPSKKIVSTCLNHCEPCVHIYIMV